MDKENFCPNFLSTTIAETSFVVLKSGLYKGGLILTKLVSYSSEAF